MPNFKGFNTINQFKKFTLTDRDLIKRDLTNAFSIRGGQMPGRPEVGTNIWNYIFDPNDAFTVSKVEQEVTRIIDLDSRIKLVDLKMVSVGNVIQVQVLLNLLPNTNTETFYINFNEETNTVIIS